MPDVPFHCCSRLSKLALPDSRASSEIGCEVVNGHNDWDCAAVAAQPSNAAQSESETLPTPGVEYPEGHRMQLVDTVVLEKVARGQGMQSVAALLPGKVE